jgi:hypothetical protein
MSGNPIPGRCRTMEPSPSRIPKPRGQAPPRVQCKARSLVSTQVTSDECCVYQQNQFNEREKGQTEMEGVRQTGQGGQSPQCWG